MKLPRFKLTTEAKTKILSQFTNESEKTSISEVLTVLENSFNTRQLAIAKKLNEAAKVHFKKVYAERAKNYLAKTESNMNVKVQNVAKMTAAKWLKENKVSLVAQIRQRKAERVEHILESLVSKFYIGLPKSTKTLVEGFRKTNKELKKENETVHLALAQRNKDASKKVKMQAYESALVGLTDTQKSKLTSLVKALPKMTSEKFLVQLKNIKGLVGSNSHTSNLVRENINTPKVESEAEIYRQLFRS